jgi:hypothetical protein
MAMLAPLLLAGGIRAISQGAKPPILNNGGFFQN